MTQPASSAAPVTVGVAVDLLAAELVALYAAAEQQLIGNVAQIAADALASRAASMRQLDMLRQMRRVANRLAVKLRLRSYPLAQQIAEQAAAFGADYAARSLQRLVNSHQALLPHFLQPGGHGRAATTRIALDLAFRLDSTLPRIMAFADDAYRAAIAEAATRQARGMETPSTAQSLAWRRLTSGGIDGFTDQSGRNWNLSSYVEMATRTAVQRAYNAAHLDRMLAMGIDYVTVNHDGHPCPLCRPWEGQVLASGQATEPPPFSVKGTVDEAIAAGLQHPNCKHVLVAYFHGVTQLTTEPAWTAEDQARYVATQQLRDLERRVRRHKRESLGALTEADRRIANAKVRGAQARIREHVDAHGLVRRPRREQLNLGNHR